ncbi:hypothetical protein C4B63_41g165 [Trypanosoma cruzi]|uniref:Uncharacterized protein n=1 Tax=Trypanosoma cruzi TaxID=5693 RepID=A0A2V2V6L7_TRYCR|nr:hypothetical protein C4B63_41g165 [Trypanosoma cruzi]
MPNQHRRIPQELGKMGSIEKHIASGMRKATDTTVPAGGRQPPPTQKHCAEHPKSAGARSAPNPRPRATTAGKRRAVCMRLAPSTSATKADGTVLSTHRNASQTKPWAAGAARHPKHRFPPPTPANAGAPSPATMAEPKRTLRLFKRRLRAEAVRRDWRRVVVIIPFLKPKKTASDRDPADPSR